MSELNQWISAEVARQLDAAAEEVVREARKAVEAFNEAFDRIYTPAIRAFLEDMSRVAAALPTSTGAVAPPLGDEIHREDGQQPRTPAR
jgi:hypothetical protein